MKKIIQAGTLLFLVGCVHVPDPYREQLSQLETSREEGTIDTAAYIRQRIKLDADHAARTGERMHYAMVRFPAMEISTDFPHHGTHYKLIEDARAAGRLSDAEYQELRLLTKEAREARNERSRKRRMDRFRMGYR